MEVVDQGSMCFGKSGKSQRGFAVFSHFGGRDVHMAGPRVLGSLLEILAPYCASTLHTKLGGQGTCSSLKVATHAWRPHFP